MSGTASQGLPLLNGLRYLGIVVEADAGRLNISAPTGVLTPAIRAAVSARKPELLAAAQLHPTPAPPLALPLSFEQERVWLAQQFAPDSPHFTLAAAFDIKGPLDAHALAQTMTDIAHRHEILRTRYVGGLEPAQIVRDVDGVPLPVVDLSGLPEEIRGGIAEQVTSAEAHRRFDLECDLTLRVLLVKLDVERHRLLILRHHIAADGWSLGLFLREMVFAYETFRQGRPSAARPPAMQYAQYAVRQRLAADEATIAAQLEYWRDTLRGADPNLFPHTAGQQSSSAGAIECRAISPATARLVAAWGREQRVTVFSTHLAAFLLMLKQRTGRSDILIATDYANREGVETESVIGMFVRRLPLRFQIQEDWSVLDLVRHIQRVTFNACSHASIPLERIGPLLHGTQPGANPFQVMFGMHGAPAHAPYRDLKLSGTAACELLDVPIATNEFPLSLYVSDSAAGPVSELRFDEKFFARGEITLLLERFEILLAAIAAQSTAPLSALLVAAAAADRRAAADYSKMRARRLAGRANGTGAPE